MLSGLFDRYPFLQVILGHLGEGLPFMLPRMQHRLDAQRFGERAAKAKYRLSYYFANNFHITTSGHFHSKPLIEAIERVGLDRVMFFTDYPYEQRGMGGRWFDDIQLDNHTKRQIDRENANRLFSLDLDPIPDTR